MPSPLNDFLASIQSSVTDRKTGSRGIKASDIALVVGAVFIIALMILPVPGWALDTLISLNIAISIVVLLFALYVSSPVAFSSFPTILLFTTLFRVALSVAATRQILLNAHAGEIIETFGKLIVGGSLVVGLVVFFVITVIQFIVVAKGAERVAEVGARFTLDALPGKQMAIDSDMRSGLINQKQASQMRDALNNESQFYGAMDGAMKFVKGDAVASIIVVAVNLIGGIAVGTLSKGMAVSQAVSTYAVLSIGDGLVSQVPALFATMAAGVIVTRSSVVSERNLAMQIAGQFATQPKALMLAGIVVSLFALVPGFPAVPFVLVGGLVILASVKSVKGIVTRAADAYSGMLLKAGPGAATPAPLVPVANAPFSLVSLHVHPALAEPVTLRALDVEFVAIASRLQSRVGLPFPGISVRVLDRDVSQIGYQVFVSEIPATDFVTLQQNADGSNAYLMANAIERAMMAHADQFLGVQETKWIVSRMEATFPDLVRESNAAVGLPRLSDLLATLVKQGVPIVDIRTILEVCLRGGGHASQAALAELCRTALARSISFRYGDARSKTIRVVALTADSESYLSGGSQITEEGSGYVDAEASVALGKELQKLSWPEDAPSKILLVSPNIRLPLSSNLLYIAPDYFVISHTEIDSGYRFDVLEYLDLAGLQAAGRNGGESGKAESGDE